MDTIQSPVEATLPSVVVNFMDIFTGLVKLSVKHCIKLQSGANQPSVPVGGSRFPKAGWYGWYGWKINVYSCKRVNWDSRVMVVAKPDGDVRICVDRSELNKAIQRQHFAVPSIEKLFRKLGKAQKFCSLDASSGFFGFFYLRQLHICAPWKLRKAVTASSLESVNRFLTGIR